MTTGFLHHPDVLDHKTGHGHPERPERVIAIMDRMKESGLLAEVERPEVAEVSTEDLALVHDSRYLESIVERCGRAPTALDSGDTVASEGTLRAARLSAGGAVQAVEKVWQGEWSDAFVCLRPPGHHAEHAEAMGFCLYNNVAVAAAVLRNRLGAERVAIVDYDVHHGNGTQHLFERDPSVFYASIHQYPHYPGTGAADERGLGDGDGATLNCPMAAGTGDREWIETVEGQIVPALARFHPDFLIISAGYDAHQRDPLSGTQLSEEGYHRMTAALRDLARDACKGRVILCLEGGYDLQALAASSVRSLETLREG